MTPLRDLVLVGGGHTHVQVLRAFAMEPPPDTRLTVVLDRPVAIYSGMVPGFVAAQYEAHELEIDVVPLARRARARVILSPAVGIDPERRRLELAHRPAIRYDLLSFDIGSTVIGLDLPGVSEHALPTRPIAELVRRVEEVLATARTKEAGSPFHVLVVGAGAGGVELAFTLRRRLLRDTEVAPHVRLLEAGERILPGYPEGLVRRALRRTQEAGIEVQTDCPVVGVDARRVRLAEGGEHPYDALVWVAGATSHPLFRDSGLPTERRGFVLVRSTLQVRGHDDLFAAGDCATLERYPETPKAGVYAVRQGPYLIDNLRAALRGARLRSYRPQPDFLTLLNLGDGSALGAKWGLSFEGAWVWRLKDWIDRRFMRRFQVLEPSGRLTSPFASQPAMEGEEMVCGGCASKVGQSVLQRALERIETTADSTVLLGPAEADDAAAWRTPAGDVLVSSVDGFRAFADDPYLVGRVAAVNAAADVQAKGARPRYAQAMVTLPEDETEEQAEETLYQVLSGGREGLAALGATLLGGHSTVGPELVVGFAVEGLLPDAGQAAPDLFPLAGARPGHRLVLTKALGTGVLLHADMQGRAAGPWLRAAIESMLGDNGTAAELARRYGAGAVTDVTGFGLAGHLGEMMHRSGTSAEIDLESIPPLPGALELLAQGLRSTFHEQNARARKGLLLPKGDTSPRLELLFDPQTSGGLLISLAAANADGLAADLRRGGGTAAIIGRVTERHPSGGLITTGGLR